MTATVAQSTVQFQPLSASEFPFATLDSGYLRQLTELFGSNKEGVTLKDDDEDSMR